LARNICMMHCKRIFPTLREGRDGMALDPGRAGEIIRRLKPA